MCDRDKNAKVNAPYNGAAEQVRARPETITAILYQRASNLRAEALRTLQRAERMEQLGVALSRIVMTSDNEQTLRDLL